MTGPTDHLEAALRHWRDRDPLAAALSDGVTWLSRGVLGQHLAAGRRVLRQAGLDPDDRVAVLMPQGFEGALVALQVASACSLAPLRPGTPAERWQAMLADLAPAALVLAAESDPALAAAAAALAIPLLPAPTLLGAAACSPHSPAAASESSAAEPPEEPPDEPTAEPGIAIATSGTTGTPKWVQHAQSSLLRGCRATAESLALSAADRALLALPLHHVHGLVSGLLMPLCSGGSVVVTERFEAAAALACIADQEISWISLPPAMHQALLDQHRRTPLAAGHRLRFLRSGAISLPPQLIADLQAAFGVPVIEAYGMSECPHICGNPIAAPRPGCVGKPVVEELAIVDGEGRPLPPGRWGQVVVRGAPVMRG
ncbi:MAG: AMP-binding protein, partial [Cyanobacteriota bacterium]|nr:AMP-binding protein [Cyanobacteriota bacterium]